MLKIEVVRLDGTTLKLVTPFEDFGITDLGIRYQDPALGFSTVKTFDKMKSFKIEGVVGEREKVRSEAMQERYSDANPLAKKRSAQWTV